MRLNGWAGFCALVIVILLSALPPVSAQTPLNIQATVQIYAGTGANGPSGLVSNAVPFKPGALTNAAHVRVLDGSVEVPVAARILANWPTDGSVRALLLQFNAPVAKTYTIQVGTVRSVPDRTFVPVTWDVPTRIFTLAPAYLSQSLIFWEQTPLGQSGFPAWDQKQLTAYVQDRYSRVPLQCARDRITTTTRLRRLTSCTPEPAISRTSITARRWALHHRRDQIYLSGASVGHPHVAPAGISTIPDTRSRKG